MLLQRKTYGFGEVKDEKLGYKETGHGSPYPVPKYVFSI
jgi:hypothetical protein